MVIKRKTVSKLASAVKARHPKEDVEEDEEMDEQIVAVEEDKELTEKELVAGRIKELKAMNASEMKQLVENLGLKTGKKEDMIKLLLKHEAKERAAAKEQKAKIRAVVIKKKQELESQSLADLSKQCESLGVKGLRSKEEKVQRLLIHWQEHDGVDKALAQIAAEERQRELQAFDSTKLQKLCTKIGVDPYVKEIMVERISKQENGAGRYSRPSLVQDLETPKETKSIDMVDSLLANESQRKKEQEKRNQQEEALAKRRKELKSLSLDELKKRIAKKGLEASSKKDDMVEALFVAVVQEDSANARHNELKAKSQQELKELLARYGLESGSKEAMIKSLRAHEAKLRENLQAFDVKVNEAAEQKKQDLEGKTNAALKEMCAKKGLALGGDKDDKIERLVDELLKERELDKVVSQNLRNKRKEELMAMDKPAIVKLCEQAKVDPFVTDIMVERILSHESEGGATIAMADAEPPAKRARVSKK